MKKVFLSLFIIVGAVLTLASCNKKQEKKIDRFDDMTVNMSYQALSSIKMLEVKDEFNSVKKLSAVKSEINTSDKEVIDRYMKMMEELLDDNGGFQTAIKNSDKAEYTNLIEITTSTIDKEKIVYSLYYNETIVNTIVEEDETETIKKINGIAVVGKKEYLLEGSIKEEIEDLETETDSTFKIIEDELNYVIVKEEKEIEGAEYEHGYKYTIVSDGKKVNEVEFEIEQEDNELSIELKEKSIDSKTSYKFKKIEEKGTKYFKIEVKNGTKVSKIKVHVVLDTKTNTYNYEYEYIERNDK